MCTRIYYFITNDIAEESTYLLSKPFSRSVLYVHVVLRCTTSKLHHVSYVHVYNSEIEIRT